jgi:hypothetical protein
MVFLDPSSHCFRSFIGCIRTFRLPIYLEAKSAAVRLPALRGRLRDGFLRRGWHGYGLGSLSRRGWHLMVSLGQFDVKMVLQAMNDVAQCAAAAQGDFLFVIIFAAASIFTIIEAIRRLR